VLILEQGVPRSGWRLTVTQPPSPVQLHAQLMSREHDAMLEWSAVATAGSDSEVRAPHSIRAFRRWLGATLCVRKQMKTWLV
jgi:hypothetical protein